MADLVCLAGMAAVVGVLYQAEYHPLICASPIVVYLMGPFVLTVFQKLMFGDGPKLVQKPGRGASVKQEEDKNRPKIQILYGSQTGTAELYAKNLGREAKKLGFNAQVLDMVDADMESLWEQKFVLFIVATYGEGEPTDTMKDFHTWLLSDERAHDPSDLSAMTFSVFGLGDSQYKHFCQMGIEFDQRLSELGGQRVHELGMGDSDTNMEEDFDSWKAELWAKASPMFGLKAKDEFADAPDQQQKLKMHPPPKDTPPPFPKTASTLPPSNKLPCWGTIVSNTELLATNPEGRSTKHIEIDCGSASLQDYEAGDHLAILPANSDKMVDEYMDLLGLTKKDESVSLVARDGMSQRNHLPNKVPVHVGLKWYFDLQGVPKKSVLRAFTHFTQDEKEREEFRSLLRIHEESRDLYHEAVAECRTTAGFLRRFPSTKVPVDLFFEMMPRTQPRFYSIASDSLVQGKKVHMCLAISDGGLCSHYMKDMAVGSKVPCFIRKSTFHLPKRNKERPTIMIGPGTGVAPLIGFVHRRKAWMAKEQLGECYFYFGCRRKNEDYIYRDLLEGAEKDGIITKLRVAFSRETDEKVYVQHLIEKDGAALMQLINDGANIYICGDAKRMARDVEATLVKILVEHGGMEKEAAMERLNKMEKSQRYLKDVWTSH